VKDGKKASIKIGKIDTNSMALVLIHNSQLYVSQQESKTNCFGAH
jgi:hypothetical protein